MDMRVQQSAQVTGRFVDLAGERFYAIENVDKMAPFFMSIVSSSDHWLFVSSRGGLTAGRVSPETALFPYVTVDKVHESTGHTGSKTLCRVVVGGLSHEWEPFNREHDGRFLVTRNLYKNLPGNKLCFEEHNRDLQLVFRYTWLSSDEFGFVRHAELENLGNQRVSVELIDGLQNILPAGTPRSLQNTSSNLVDAYKWNELDTTTGLALYTLYSGITDRAEPKESLRANTVFYLGEHRARRLLSSQQINHFRLNQPISELPHTRGTRGAYLVHLEFPLQARTRADWRLVANVERSQQEVVELLQALRQPEALAARLQRSIDAATDQLERILARADGVQATNQENVSAHHYTNVLFNVLRGGVFHDHYQVSMHDFALTIAHFNQRVYDDHKLWFETQPQSVDYTHLLEQVRQRGDKRLEALCQEYLPITFGRRHGDPSRPWNQFAIRLKDADGNIRFFYEGNWRDIFQNWEALTRSYPEFIEAVIAKFVNASTVDGYNPYRITKQGIDWEVEDPEDPWSYIGYWGDHQIIYLLKLLESSRSYHPQRLGELLRRDLFSYANVPYRIKPLSDLLADPKNTVTYAEDLALSIDQRVERIGADGKLLLDQDDAVIHVNLMEKLLVPLLAKLGNLVVDGGLWLNTQRPEWNDANNALVGQGLSMVTLYYLRRYVDFLETLLVDEQDVFTLSSEVGDWLSDTAVVFNALASRLDARPVDDQLRHLIVIELGQASERYRSAVYHQQGFSGKTTSAVDAIRILCRNVKAVIDHSIAQNRRDDGLYHAYNLMQLDDEAVRVGRLQAMLEGQVAVLSSGALTARQAVEVIEALFASELYRVDQRSFMLYPDRPQVRFLDKNVLDEDSVNAIPSLVALLDANNRELLIRDASGTYRFNPDLVNQAALEARIDRLAASRGEQVERDRSAIVRLYRKVFKHAEFTGRSEGMFGFEGLGCIYWHMVSKLLLAVQECFFAAHPEADKEHRLRLGQLYYRVREGIGFNKSPRDYGAFPTDPYSHTPRHAGARQPGMTGQVKEEVLSRLGELGLMVENGQVRFNPVLLRPEEFLASDETVRYLDVDEQWQELQPGNGELVFTWCQVPIVYRLTEDNAEILIRRQDGAHEARKGLQLSQADSARLMQRSGSIRMLEVQVPRSMLFVA